MICNFSFERVMVCRSTYQGKGDNIASIKDVFKWCAGPCFSQLLGAQFQIRVLHPSFTLCLDAAFVDQWDPAYCPINS